MYVYVHSLLTAASSRNDSAKTNLDDSASAHLEVLL